MLIREPPADTSRGGEIRETDLAANPLPRSTARLGQQLPQWRPTVTSSWSMRIPLIFHPPRGRHATAPSTSIPDKVSRRQEMDFHSGRFFYKMGSTLCTKGCHSQRMCCNSSRRSFHEIRSFLKNNQWYRSSVCQ